MATKKNSSKTSTAKLSTRKPAAKKATAATTILTAMAHDAEKAAASAVETPAPVAAQPEPSTPEQRAEANVEAAGGKVVKGKKASKKAAKKAERHPGRSEEARNPRPHEGQPLPDAP
jgi:hypothetical protein